MATASVDKKDAEDRLGENRRADANWQVNKSLSQCTKHLYDTKEAADVTFVIHYEQGDSKDSPVARIAAHKLILLSRSPVFHAMFCGEIPFTDTDITVNDVDPDAFNEVLRYMYYDEARITGNNILFVMYASKKYLLPALTTRCTTFLEKDLSPANVCLILEHSIFFSEDQLVAKALQVVQDNTVPVLDSAAFTNLSSPALGRILALESVSAEEVDIFAACMEWSSAECERQGLEDTPENQRQVLGEHLNNIRFPTMTIQQFADIVVPSGVLNDREGFMIFQCFVCQTKPDVSPFTTNPRTKPGPRSPVVPADHSCVIIPGPYSSKTVSVGYKTTVDLYCLITKEVQVHSLLLHDFHRKTGQAFTKFEVEIVQEQEQKGLYSNTEDIDTLQVAGETVARIPLKQVHLKAGKFKVHMNRWVVAPGTTFSLSGVEFNLKYGENDKPFVGTDKTISIKVAGQKEMPLYGLEYALIQ